MPSWSILELPAHSLHDKPLMTQLYVLQLYGSNAPDDETVFFGDKGAKKFGTYFVREGKVVGAFLEGGSNEENASLSKLAQQQPQAPSDLAQQGLSFASKL